MKPLTTVTSTIELRGIAVIILAANEVKNEGNVRTRKKFRLIGSGSHKGNSIVGEAQCMDMPISLQPRVDDIRQTGLRESRSCCVTTTSGKSSPLCVRIYKSETGHWSILQSLLIPVAPLFSQQLSAGNRILKLLVSGCNLWCNKKLSALLILEY